MSLVFVLGYPVAGEVTDVIATPKHARLALRGWAPKQLGAQGYTVSPAALALQGFSPSVSIAPVITPAARAFYGAEGFGAFATGGRGGQIIRVTNLNDSGAGSFREACNTSGARTVIFDVGGTINLTSALTITKDYITIAGQTAPGDGILLRGSNVQFEIANFIVRYVRFRSHVGGNYVSTGDPKSPHIVCNGIFDHISMSWPKDGQFWHSTGGKLTLQWSITAEGTDSSKGANLTPWDGSQTTLHHCLFMSNKIRNPNVTNSKNSPSASAVMTTDMRWNVRYNCLTSGKLGRDPYPLPTKKINTVGWYIKKGPVNGSSNLHTIENDVQNVEVYHGNTNYLTTTQLGTGSISVHPTAELIVKTDPHPIPADFAVVGRHAPDSSPSADEVAREARIVVDTAGACIPTRDSVDTQHATDFVNNTGPTNLPIGTPTYPTIANGTPPTDTGNTGMPDAWRNGLDITGSQVTHNCGNGYTFVELYHNALGARTREPDGYTRFAEHCFYALPPADDGQNGEFVGGGTSGTGIIQGFWSRATQKDSNYSIVQDVTAPISGINVFRQRYPSGMDAGTSPGKLVFWDAAQGAVLKQKLYFSEFFKFGDSSFEMAGGGIKHIWIGVGPDSQSNNECFFWIPSNGAGTIQSAFNLSFTNQASWAGITYDQGDAGNEGVGPSHTWAAGSWHHLQAVLELNSPGQANGVLKVYIDEVPILDFDDVIYRDNDSSHGFTILRYPATYGGGGHTKTRHDYVYLDHLYVSGVDL